MSRRSIVRLVLVAVLAVLGSGLFGHRAEATSAAAAGRSVAAPGSLMDDRLRENDDPGTRQLPRPTSVPGGDLRPGDSATSPGANGVEIGPNGREIMAGAVLVKFKPAAGFVVQSDAHRAVGALSVQPLALPDVQLVRVAPGTVASAVASYQGRADVEYAEPDYVRRASFTPNDSSFGQQWGLTKIGAAQAWERARSRRDIKIAILDCGIYSGSSTFGSGHPDVRDKVVAEIDTTGSPSGTDDDCDHATHVAGIAAASTNNGVGVAGLGFDASIMNGKVLTKTRGGVSTIAQGLVWAADNGARVINMSLGGPGPCSSTEQAAVTYAWNHGAVIVAAAGNDGDPASGSPANCTNVISVAATDQNDRRTDFSNYGLNVDVAAPGKDILSANYVGGYKEKDGTSMASPFVAGLAALVWGTSYGTSNQAVVDRILSTADRISVTGTYWTHGRINASAAVAASAAPPAPTTTPAPTLVPTPTFTPTPVPCASPVPGTPALPQLQGSVRVTAVAAGSGRLRVTMDAPAGHTIGQIVWMTPPNAVAESLTGCPLPQGVTLPAIAQSFSFYLRRLSGQSVTVPVLVSGSFGTWRTLIGGGGAAW